MISLPVTPLFAVMVIRLVYRRVLSATVTLYSVLLNDGAETLDPMTLTTTVTSAANTVNVSDGIYSTDCGKNIINSKSQVMTILVSKITSQSSSSSSSSPLFGSHHFSAYLHLLPITSRVVCPVPARWHLPHWGCSMIDRSFFIVANQEMWKLQLSPRSRGWEYNSPFHCSLQCFILLWRLHYHIFTTCCINKQHLYGLPRIEQNRTERGV